MEEVGTFIDLIRNCLIEDGIDLTGVTIIDPLEVDWLRLGNNSQQEMVGIMFKSRTLATAIHIKTDQMRDFALKLLEMCNKATIT